MSDHRQLFDISQLNSRWQSREPAAPEPPAEVVVEPIAPLLEGLVAALHDTLQGRYSVVARWVGLLEASPALRAAETATDDQRAEAAILLDELEDLLDALLVP